MTADARRALTRAGLWLGIGLGGFVDGIVLHQLLQWHHMLSAKRPPVDVVSIKVNMFWDGVFHAFTWCACAAGVLLLFSAARAHGPSFSTRGFAGALAVGWGLFNLIEGLIDHQLLGLHHVRDPEAPLTLDLLFLASGVLLIVGGLLAIRRS